MNEVHGCRGLLLGLWVVGTACGGGAALSPARDAVNAPAGTRRVEFSSTDLTLKGVLHVPARREGTTRPGIVLVHGSGPQSRDVRVPGQLSMPFGFELPVFEQLANQLNEAGYACLRLSNAHASI